MHVHLGVVPVACAAALAACQQQTPCQRACEAIHDREDGCFIQQPGVPQDEVIRRCNTRCEALEESVRNTYTDCSRAAACSEILKCPGNEVAVETGDWENLTGVTPAPPTTPAAAVLTAWTDLGKARVDDILFDGAAIWVARDNGLYKLDANGAGSLITVLASNKTHSLVKAKGAVLRTSTFESLVVVEPQNATVQIGSYTEANVSGSQVEVVSEERLVMWAEGVSGDPNGMVIFDLTDGSTTFEALAAGATQEITSWTADAENRVYYRAGNRPDATPNVNIQTLGLADSSIAIAGSGIFLGPAPGGAAFSATETPPRLLKVSSTGAATEILTLEEVRFPRRVRVNAGKIWLATDEGIYRSRTTHF
jgi:hypothetical protein